MKNDTLIALLECVFTFDFLLTAHHTVLLGLVCYYNKVNVKVKKQK
jgi:hypothetical protein